MVSYDSGNYSAIMYSDFQFDVFSFSICYTFDVFHHLQSHTDQPSGLLSFQHLGVEVDLAWRQPRAGHVGFSHSLEIA